MVRPYIRTAGTFSSGVSPGRVSGRIYKGLSATAVCQSNRYFGDDGGATGQAAGVTPGSSPRPGFMQSQWLGPYLDSSCLQNGGVSGRQDGGVDDYDQL